MTYTPDFLPSDSQIRWWEAEHAKDANGLTLAQYIADRAAHHAADIELEAWFACFSKDWANSSTAFRRERRPPAPKAVIHRDGFTYHLAPNQ